MGALLSVLTFSPILGLQFCYLVHELDVLDKTRGPILLRQRSNQWLHLPIYRLKIPYLVLTLTRSNTPLENFLLTVVYIGAMFSSTGTS